MIGNLGYGITIIIFVTVLVSCFLIFRIAKGDKNEKLFSLFIVAAIIIISSCGLFVFDTITGHDVDFHMMRIKGMSDNILALDPFNKVNYVFNWGYGSLDAIFYPRLFLWIPAVMVAFGSTISYAYKIFLVIINIATAVISYVCFGKMSKSNKIALMICAVYTLNPYRMNDIYIRSALGELLYISFLPIVLYGIYVIFKEDTKKWYILMIGAVLVFQSHIIGTVLTATAGMILIIIYIIQSIVQKSNCIKKLKSITKAAIGAILLNAWFLVPILYYIKQDFNLFKGQESIAKVKFYSQTFKDIFFGIFNLNSISILSYIGAMIALIISISLTVSLIYIWKNKSTKEGTGILLIACLFLLCASKYAPWDIIESSGILSKFFTTAQFSFRFISMFLALLSMSSSLVFKGNDIMKKISVIFIMLILVSGCFYYNIEYKIDNEIHLTVSGYDGEYNFYHENPKEYIMRQADVSERKREDKVRSSGDEIKIKNYMFKNNVAEFYVENEDKISGYAEIPIFYFDGYAAFSENYHEYLPVQLGEGGVVRVIIPQDINGNISVKYDLKWFMHIANIVSIVTAAAFLIYLLINKRKNYLQNESAMI